jgi:hypothetical protein
MTESRPGGTPRPFGPDELDGVSGIAPDELAAARRLARDLEGVAARGTVRPSADFADRVMAAVAKEPVAAPARAAGFALRHGAIGLFLASLRDAWRVTFSPAFPMAARAQAVAMVLVVASVATGSGVVTAGAVGLFDLESPEPTLPVESPVATASPDPSVSPEFTVSPSPTVSPSVEGSEEPSGSSEPGETAEPGESADSHGGGSGGAITPAPTREPTPRPTVRPTRTPTPTRKPTPTPSPSSSHDEDGHSTNPSHTAAPLVPPVVTPAPSASPNAS